MSRLLAQLFAWSPASILLWIFSPDAVPEALRESPSGPVVLFALRTTIVAASLVWAWHGARKEPAPATALRTLVSGLAVLGGLLACGFAAVFIPTREIDRRCGAAALEEVVCERFTFGFSPDAPYYRLHKGRPSSALCAAMSSNEAPRTWTFSWRDDPQVVQDTTCPAALASEGARCFETEWRAPNGSHFLGMIALDRACEGAVLLTGRGQLVRDRRDRIRGFAR